MWGLLFFAALGIGSFVHACKNADEDGRSRQNSSEKGDEYYLDRLGCQRRVDNNHQVVRTFDESKGYHLDDVLMDVQTGQILHNYSNDERAKRRAMESKQNVENKKYREDARKRGSYYYLAYYEPPVACGLYHDLYAEQYKREPISVYYWHYPRCHYRRVSDNLLMSSHGREARFNLILYNEKAEKNNDINIINQCVDINWRIINTWEEQAHIYWHENTPYPTAAEVEEYARKVGAYLEYREET